ncbi:MAG: hypothetical protein U7127_31440 (plasmid) [Phormidium sp.]
MTYINSDDRGSIKMQAYKNGMKRIQVTLPDAVAEDLEKWAISQRRPVANLAAYLLERSIDEAKERGIFPEDKKKITEQS